LHQKTVSQIITIDYYHDVQLAFKAAKYMKHNKCSRHTHYTLHYYIDVNYATLVLTLLIANSTLLTVNCHLQF